MSKADTAKKAAELEKKLADKSFLHGSQPTDDDKAAFVEMFGADNHALHSWIARMGGKGSSLQVAKTLEPKLKGKPFLGGNTPSEEDVFLFRAMLGENNVNLYRWVKHLASFSTEERKNFPAPQKSKGTTYSIVSKK